MLTQLEIQVYAERTALFNDQHAFKMLFEHFYEKLNRFISAFVKDTVIAKEITSDVFIILWKNRARLTEIENLNGYLYIIARNLSVKRLGKIRNNNEFFIDDLKISLPESGFESSPEDLLVNNEMLRHIEKAIDNLPPKCKLIYLLVRQEGLKYKEIASVLNISVRTIDAQMAIATKKIASAIRFIFNEK